MDGSHTLRNLKWLFLNPHPDITVAPKTDEPRLRWRESTRRTSSTDRMASGRCSGNSAVFRAHTRS